MKTRTVYSYKTRGYNGVETYNILALRDAAKFPSRTKEWRQLKSMFSKPLDGSKFVRVVSISWENFQGDDYLDYLLSKVDNNYMSETFSNS